LINDKENNIIALIARSPNKENQKSQNIREIAGQVISIHLMKAAFRYSLYCLHSRIL